MERDGGNDLYRVMEASKGGPYHLVQAGAAQLLSNFNSSSQNIEFVHVMTHNHALNLGQYSSVPIPSLSGSDHMAVTGSKRGLGSID